MKVSSLSYYRMLCVKLNGGDELTIPDLADKLFKCATLPPPPQSRGLRPEPDAVVGEPAMAHCRLGTSLVGETDQEDETGPATIEHDGWGGRDPERVPRTEERGCWGGGGGGSLY